MDFKDYYQILGVDELADAKALKLAYRRLAKKYHPDVSSQSDAEEKFKEVAEAYEVLKDPDKRARYDELKRYGGSEKGFTPPPDWQAQGAQGGYSGEEFSDFFSSIFGGHGGFGRAQSATNRGRDIETELPVLLEETMVGLTKTISFQVPNVQPDGRVAQANKTLNVKIPAGVLDGERIRLKGQGGLGAAGNGDLYLHIRLVPHPLFDVEGHNLVMTLPIAPWEAALGAKIVVPTLKQKIQLAIPAHSQTGQRLRVANKGLPKRQGQGDLLVVLKVVIPPENSIDLQEHWQALASAATFDPRAQWETF